MNAINDPMLTDSASSTHTTKIFYSTATTTSNVGSSSSIAHSSITPSYHPFESIAEPVSEKLTIEEIALWFLSKKSMSSKKLQKLCYYAYCWFIVFYNDLEHIDPSNEDSIETICDDHFQAWIHGPVQPRLYRIYKKYGWSPIPSPPSSPIIPAELESLLNQVWDAYGTFSADQLESISHEEDPWKTARKGYAPGDACTNVISRYDILEYYSHLE